MKHTWYPDDYVASTYQIDFAQLAKEGYRGVIFDVDNTLVEHNAPADERAIAFFTMLHDNGYKALLLSNNAEPRVQSFKEASGADAYIYKAGKPSPKSYQKAMEILGTTPETTLFVGDQIFTDIMEISTYSSQTYSAGCSGSMIRCQERLKDLGCRRHAVCSPQHLRYEYFSQ